MWLELTDAMNGKRISVNMNLVWLMETTDDGTKLHSVSPFDDDDDTFVNETREEIMQLLKAPSVS